MDCPQDASRCYSTMPGKWPALALSLTMTRRDPLCGGIKATAPRPSHRLPQLARYLYRQVAATLLALDGSVPKCPAESRRTGIQSRGLFEPGAADFAPRSHTASQRAFP